MNRLEHLLFRLAEECSEVAQRASKAAVFGIDEVQPGQLLTNEERLWLELNDVAAIGEMLIELRRSGGLSRTAVDAKKSKVEQMLVYSAKCGTLREYASGHCREGYRCVCGGDTARVRQGCSNWISATGSAKGSKP